MKIGLLFNGVVGVILAVPVVRLYPVPRDSRTKAGDEPGSRSVPWINFPAGQTRLATYRNPARALGRRNCENPLLGA